MLSAHISSIPILNIRPLIRPAAIGAWVAPALFAVSLAIPLTNHSLASPLLLVAWMALAAGILISHRPAQFSKVMSIPIGIIVVSAFLAIPGSLLLGDGKVIQSAILAIFTATTAVYFFSFAGQRTFLALIPGWILQAIWVIAQKAAVMTPSGFTGNPNVAAGFMLMGIIYISQTRIRWLSIVLAFALPLTDARWAMIVYIGLLTAMAIRRVVPWRYLFVSFLLSMVAIVVPWHFITAGLGPETVALKIPTPATLLSGRNNNNDNLLQAIRQDIALRLPVLRVPTLNPRGFTDDGPGHETPHNVPLRMAIESGVPSALAWLWLTFSALRRGGTRKPEWWMLLAISMLSMMYYYPWGPIMGGWWFLLIGMLVKERPSPHKPHKLESCNLYSFQRSSPSRRHLYRSEGSPAPGQKHR